MDNKNNLTLDDVDTHQDECICRQIERITQNKDNLSPKDWLRLADVVEILSEIGV